METGSFRIMWHVCKATLKWYRNKIICTILETFHMFVLFHDEIFLKISIYLMSNTVCIQNRVKYFPRAVIFLFFFQVMVA